MTESIHYRYNGEHLPEVKAEVECLKAVRAEQGLYLARCGLSRAVFANIDDLYKPRFKEALPHVIWYNADTVNADLLMIELRNQRPHGYEAVTGGIVCVNSRALSQTVVLAEYEDFDVGMLVEFVEQFQSLIENGDLPNLDDRFFDIRC